jgi:hypothetical protein
MTTDRWALTKKYVIDNMYMTPENCHIIGDWSKFENNIPDNRRELFKGTIPPNELYSSIAKYKYAILFSMCRGMSSGKFYEMIAAGVIPFCIEDYDTSNSLCSENSFTKVKSVEELNTKIKYFEDNPEMYKKAITTLRSNYKNILLQHRQKFDDFVNNEVCNELFKEDNDK